MATNTTTRLARSLPSQLFNYQHSGIVPPGVSQQKNFSVRAMSAEFLKHYAKLPHLPVPKLQQTLDKYLMTAKPLLGPEEFTTTTQIAQAFSAPGGAGEKLQRLLEQKANNEPNWLSQWWLENAYLGYRLPVVVHSNPALVFPKQNFQSQSDQIAYAAKLIAGALRFKSIIDEAKLEQDYLGKSPLDMSQYTKVFNGCRVPGVKMDMVYQNPDSKHIVVAYNNNFYKMQVYTASGEIADDADILSCLIAIVQSSESSPEPVGFFTTEHRDAWGSLYQELTKDPVNRESLKVINDSMFVMCLDKKNSTKDQASPKSRIALQLLHGYGSENNSGNRWFDKTLQLIVGTDGVNGLCYEHSPTEGPPIANLADFIVKYADSKGIIDGVTQSPLSADRLRFNLSPSLQSAIESAKRNIDVLVQDVEINSFTFDKFGKEDIKALKFSPDSFIQIAIQMAFIRLHGHPTAHYESGSMRKFTAGRTETIRTCLPEIVDFAKLHLESEVHDPAAKLKALQAAMKAHKDYVQDAIDGKGIDRHLMGLKLIAIENGIDIPNFYRDPAYSTSNNWRCSTSQVAAIHDMVMCYGPVVPDGYGCCYNPRRDEINFAVSAFNSNSTTSALKFGEALEASLVDIRNIALFRLTNSKL